KYNIPAHETVRRWIIIYTKGEGLKTYSPKPEVYAMKSRNVTHDEKVKIVKDCLANELSYKETAEKYRIPYNNVYSWVQKYKEQDRKSTRLNSSHVSISYAVFCLKKNKT